MGKRFYAAYGSNLNLPQMRKRCPCATVVGTAVIEDYRLLFRGSKTGSYLTIEPQEGGRVPVAVWEVTDEDERRLDQYEGYPAFYRKESMELDVTLAGFWKSAEHGVLCLRHAGRQAPWKAQQHLFLYVQSGLPELRF